MNQWKHFTENEVKGIDPHFVSVLDVARELAGVPFVITSGFRNEATNMAVDGVKDSAHTRGLAVDISCPNSRKRHHILKGLYRAGFDRIGIYKKHIHADLDYKKTVDREVSWLG